MKGLKIITSVLLLAVICTADETEEILKELEKYESECREENGVSKEEGENHLKKLCANEEIEKNVGCYMACFHTKIGAMKDGEILVDSIKESLIPLIKHESAKNELLNKLDTCKAEISTESDDCDKTVEFTKCLIKGSELCKHILE
ncbi:PREDICTED: general odorant-binding protein 56a [Polistes dominula]|uniref:General odorant-binding protein 56a n=1 Tax=Polistes dominula TaxID=743375 RepID=A0ABM1IR82_POLDO|nr:PREDICTED: general odorant-binding protein 56a [Polistes dominula]